MSRMKSREDEEVIQDEEYFYESRNMTVIKDDSEGTSSCEVRITIRSR